MDGPESSRLEHGITCLAWNDNPFEPAKIAVGGYSRRAVTLTFSASGMSEECVLGELHVNPVHDIAWAPSMGRSYHLIATASREPFIRVCTSMYMYLRMYMLVQDLNICIMMCS